MSIAIHFTRGIAWMTIGNWSEQALNLLVFVVLVRLLGAESFGILTMAMALILIGEGLVRETISEYIFSAKNTTTEMVDALFWALFLVGGGLTLLLIICAPGIAILYDTPEVRNLLWACAPIIFLTGITAVPVALLKQRMNIRPLAARAFYGVLIGGIVGIGLAFAGAGVWALAAQRIVLTFVNVAMAWYSARWRPGPWRGFAGLVGLGTFARNMLTYRLAEMGNIQLPSVAIGMAIGPVSLGYYAIAWRLVELGSFLIVTPVRTAALPAFSAKHSGNELGVLFADTLRLIGFIAIPAFVGFAVTASDVLMLFGGEPWLPAAPTVSILAFFGMALCSAKVEETFALALGHSQALAAISTANLILLALFLFMLAPMGLEGMAAAVVLAAIAVIPFRLRLVSRLSGLPLYLFFRQQIGPLVASMVMAAVLLMLEPWRDSLPTLISLAVTAVIGALIYGAIAMWRMKRRLLMAQGYLSSLRRGASDAIRETKGGPA